VKIVIGITQEEFSRLADYIKANYGIYLKDEKKALVVGRLQNILIEKNCKSFSEYYNYIMSDKSGQAAVTMMNKITTNHTFFMREPVHFEYFRDSVLPFWAHNLKDRDLRVWSAGCSSGEEPYTLSMIIDEYFGKEKSLWDARVLATDISEKALEKAKNGIYANKDVAALPYGWKLNYFTALDNANSVLSNRIKQEVIFRKFNLMTPLFPFRKKFHVIFCRNVMIYFNEETRQELVNKFYDATESGGYLFIGHSESLNREATKYQYLMPAVYRKE
jgi:Methylase of chemotaxis methyl-accepting proteins